MVSSVLVLVLVVACAASSTAKMACARVEEAEC